MLVFHKIRPSFEVEISNAYEAIEAMSGNEYRVVAQVQADSLEDTFDLTNHISSRWDDADHDSRVLPVGKMNRSTSVGDFILHDNGSVYTVDPVGWTEVATRKSLLDAKRELARARTNAALAATKRYDNRENAPVKTLGELLAEQLKA